MLRGFPWWYSGWEVTCQCRGHGFNPWSGKVSHALEPLSPSTTSMGFCSRAQEPQLLSLCATTTEARVPQSPHAATTEPVLLEPVLHKRRQDSKPVHCNQEQPLLSATRESPCAAAKTQSKQFFLIKKKKIFEGQEGLHTDIIKKNFFIVIMLYIASLGLISLITGCFCLLNIVTYSTPYTPNLFSVSMRSVCVSVCLYVSVYVCVFLHLCLRFHI